MTYSSYIHTDTEYNLQLKRLRMNPPKQVNPGSKVIIKIWASEVRNITLYLQIVTAIS